MSQGKEEYHKIESKNIKITEKKKMFFVKREC